MLASIKLGAVVIPATTLLPPADLSDRIERGNAKVVVTSADQVGKFRGKDGVIRVVVGETGEPGWVKYDPSGASAAFAPDRANQPRRSAAPLLHVGHDLAAPKLVLHSHRSYPVGHLSTMFWIGLRPGDIHFNISSPGWAKHAWSSFFAPWNAGALLFVVSQPRFRAKSLLGAVVRAKVTTALPRSAHRLAASGPAGPQASGKPASASAASAGEPLNPEVIERVRAGWGITIRDGSGQDRDLVPDRQLAWAAAQGRLYGPADARLLADADRARRRRPRRRARSASPPMLRRPAALMQGYDTGEPGKPLQPLGTDLSHRRRRYMRDKDGYITYVGRNDDVFKSSDYRISPFELESILIEHPAVAEAGVIPAPDPIRLSVPKAFIALVPGKTQSRDLAADIFRAPPGGAGPVFF